jgi:hypothetical protein
MKTNRWTHGLFVAGLLSRGSIASADEQPKASPVMTALSATTLSGYVDTMTIWKFGTGNANMPGRVYDGPDVQDGFNLSVVSLTLDKPLDESQWAAGYHIQMLMGPGAAKRGTGLLASFSSTEFSFNEAYIAVRLPIGNGIDFHVGQLGTYNGYEAYDTYKDPNWSRSYGFYIESSAHTGVSASYKVSDAITLMAAVGNEAGFNNQVDARQATESRKAYLTMITLTAPESMGFLKGATLSGGYTVGASAPAYGAWNQGNIYVGASIPTPVTGLSVGAAYDYTHGSAGFAASYANATALYVAYQPTEKWKFNNRFDYATGSSGAFGYVSKSGHPHNQLFSYTSTIDYALWKNVISRAEFRWDHTLSGDRPFGGTTPGVGRDKNAVSLGMNLIYMF